MNAPKPPSSQNEVEIPALPENRQQVLEVPLPDQFKGCWYGDVVGLDSKRALSCHGRHS